MRKTCSAARARTSPRWPISACRCRRASPSRPRSAPTTTPTARRYPADLAGQVDAALAEVGKIAGKTFGDGDQPAAGVGALGRARLDARHDGHGAQPRPQRRDRRGARARSPATSASPMTAIAASSPCIPNVVLGVEHHHFEDILDDHKDRNGYSLDTDLTADDWIEAGQPLQGARRGGERQAVPAGPARAAVGRDRRGVRLVDERSAPSPIAACTTSRKAGAPRSTCRRWCSATWATTSATGVAFTRNPSTGEKKLYGEFLINAQGEDVVAGIRTPQEITEVARKEAGSDKPSLEARCRRRSRN